MTGPIVYPGCPRCQQPNHPLAIKCTGCGSLLSSEALEAERVIETDGQLTFGPALEQRFQATLDVLRNPKRLAASWVLVGSLVLFLLVGRGERSLGALAVLVGVLLFHELGHFAGMKAFGYRDVRMFFIPFFGAAVSGKRAGVAPWKEAVVLLLGPVPGVLRGLQLASCLEKPGAGR